jgi:hypothetical protein
MRKVILSLISFLVVSCGTDYRNPEFEEFRDTDYRCFQINGNTAFENGDYNIRIYLGSVRRKGLKSWTPSLFTHCNSDPFPYSGYAAGFTFNPSYGDRKGDREPKHFKVRNVTVSFNGGSAITYKRLKVKPGGSDFKFAKEEDYWVPPSFPVDGDKAPELPRGKYRVRVHYHADGNEYEAHWDLIYRPRLRDQRPKAPTCSTRKRGEQGAAGQPSLAALSAMFSVITTPAPVSTLSPASGVASA